MPEPGPLRRVITRIRGADLSVGAAAVAYNSFLALVPLTVALVGVAAMFGDDAGAIASVESALEPIAPDTVVVFITSLMRDAAARVGDSGIVIVVGSALVSVYLGSRAIVALQRSLAVVVGEVEVRPPLQLRLVGLALTALGGVTLAVMSVSVIAGGALFTFLSGLTGWGWLADVGPWLGLPLAVACVFGFLLAFYLTAAPRPVPRPYLATGLAVAGIVAGSLGFGWYLSAAPNLGATFGTLGAVAVAMVWLYLGALSILAGPVAAAALAPADPIKA